jgi:radical SAM protein with 4Fe4S-binding SPASM domain
VRPFHLPGSYLVLELTNRCSLKCLHCSVSEAGHPHHRSHGFLPFDLAESLFEDLRRVGGRFDTLIPFWLGEPLLHPRFAELYRLALRTSVEHGLFQKVEVHSNATHLDSAVTAAVLNRAKVPQTWHFSMDAITEGTYRRVKGVDRYATVLANVEAFLEEKARKGAIFPRPVFQFIVSDRNAAEAEAFREHWEKIGRKLGMPVVAAAQRVPEGSEAVVYYRQLDCPTAEEQTQQNEVYARTVERLGLTMPVDVSGRVEAENRGVCGCFWKSPVVGWDGRLTVCTRDNLQENCLGNLKERRFSELWWGEGMAGRRRQVATGDYTGLVPCKTCFIPRSSNYSDILPAQIRAAG